MIEFFLSSSLSCGDARILISRIKRMGNELGSRTSKELIHEIKSHAPECFNERSVQHR
jgi:hypothetical protein